jgi:phosphoglycolate phosphatase
MNVRSYELIIFDWDGTLMDSAAKIVHCFERAYADAGVSYPGDAAVRRIIGLGLAEAVAALLPEASPALRTTVADHYRRYFLGLDAESMSLFPGVREGLVALAAQGCLLAVATGKSRRGLDRMLAHTGLGDMFVATRCADEAFSKPHPRMLEDILDRTGLTASQAIMVGDTTYDLLMAKAANMAGLGVSYGVHAREELLQHGALACCDSFDEVMTWLHRMPPNQSVRAARS